MDTPAPSPLRQRLLDAAKTCFLADDYHAVSTRRIAEAAGANVSMIRYYFGSKEGLYEEMIRDTLQPLLDVLDGEMLASLPGPVLPDHGRLAGVPEADPQGAGAPAWPRSSVHSATA